LAGVGVCGCEDADGDGSCASDDCDDGNASAAPGQGEVCGDGVDNDCSGDIDEDCEPAAEPDAGGEGDAPTDEGGLSGEGEIRDGGSGGCQHADPASFWGVFGLAAALLWRSRRRVSSTR
jgi:MYXO-CTERM domain-containing protein